MNTMILLLILVIILLVLLAYTFWLTMSRLQRCCASQPKCPLPTACPPAPVCPACPQLPAREILDPITQRDRAVNNDPLYPPLNRMPMPRTVSAGEDTYRFVGYMINKMDKEDTWKLFGREKRRNQGEFYVSSANKNNDIKIMITQEMVVGTNRLRGVFDIPDELMIKHPMFAPTPYAIIVNPNTDLSASHIYY